jgi:quinol monooxygenase YgiN
MENIIFHVTYTCKPGMAEAFINAVRERGLQEKTRQEDGCMQYDYHISCEVPDTVVLVELWRDKEAVKVHAEQPAFQEISKLKDEYVLNTDLQRFKVAPKTPK